MNSAIRSARTCVYTVSVLLLGRQTCVCSVHLPAMSIIVRAESCLQAWLQHLWHTQVLCLYASWIDFCTHVPVTLELV